MRVAIFALFFCSLALALTPDMAAKNHATYYKKKLPFICTPTLTLNDILNVGDTLIYRYAVKHARKQEIKRLEEKELLEFIEAIKKENLRTACKDKEILNMLSIGVSLDEIFYSENGELIFEYTIKDEFYQNGKEALCNSGMARAALNRGITLSGSYGFEGRHLFDLKLDKSSCE